MNATRTAPARAVATEPAPSPGELGLDADVAGLTPAQRAAFRAAVEDAFASLYRLDPAALTPAQRQQHQQQITAVYLAMLAVENADFAALTDAARAELPALAARVQQVQGDLAGMKKAAKVLAVVDEALGVFSKVAQLLA